MKIGEFIRTIHYAPRIVPIVIPKREIKPEEKPIPVELPKREPALVPSIPEKK